MLYLAPRTFREVACAYFGLASPAVAPYGPLEIPCGGRAGPRVSDPHGVQLGLATLPGGDFDTRSAAIESVLHADMALAGLPQLQRQARRLFQGVVQPGARAHGRAALVPDLTAQLRFPDTYERLRRGERRPAARWDGDHAQRHLFDVKAFGRGVAHYATALARDLRAGAAESYAHGVHAEYVRQARAVDQRPPERGGHGVAEGVVGPVEQRLRTFPRVHGLAFGGYGEASGAVEALRRVVAREQAQRRWRQMGARSPTEAAGILASQLRRRWGIAACRAQAELTLRRLIWIGARRADARPAAHEDVGEAVRGARAAAGPEAYAQQAAAGGGDWAPQMGPGGGGG